MIAATLAMSLVLMQGPAIEHWHRPPPCGMPQVVAGDLSAVHTGGEAVSEECLIIIDGGSPWTDRTLCIAVVHEYGHLLGRDHSFIAGDVMNEDDPWSAEVPECSDPERSRQLACARAARRLGELASRKGRRVRAARRTWRRSRGVTCPAIEAP